MDGPRRWPVRLLCARGFGSPLRGCGVGSEDRDSFARSMTLDPKPRPHARRVKKRGALLALLILGLPSGVLAATIKGKVGNTHDLLNPVWNEAKEPSAHRFTFREPSPSVPPDVRVLRGHLSKELCIVALTEADAQPMKKPIRVVIEGGRTSVVTLVVPPGQEILFENHDPTDRGLYEVTGKGQFGKGVIKPDQSRTWTPPGPGKYEFRDELNPSLRSWVVVEPKAFKSIFPNRKGDFSIELDPGVYTLRTYFNGEPVGDAMPLDVKPAPPEQPLKDPLKAGADKKDETPKPEPGKAGG